MKRPHIKLHWEFRVNNFGDMFTVYLLTHYFGVLPYYVKPEEAEMFGSGSIAEKIPENFKGIVFGTGKMHRDTKLPDFSGAKVLGLRGKLTAEGLNVPLFDPGILSFLFCKTKPRCKIGIVPNYHDRRLVKKYPKARLIRIFDSVPDVINGIGECERIISSSLHGLIVADSLGIPRKYMPYYKNTFKFEDYHTVPVKEAKKSALAALKRLGIELQKHR